VVKGKAKGGRLSVLKGKEARLNRAIFHILALQSPLITYDIHKEVKAQKGLKHTKYTNVLRRIRALEELGYLEKAGTRKIKTQRGSQATLYQLATRAYLAILLNEVSLDNFVQKAHEGNVETMLVALALHASILEIPSNLSSQAFHKHERQRSNSA